MRSAPPERVVARHPANHRGLRRRWSASRTRAPSPDRAESRAVPTKDRVGLHEQQSALPARCPSRGEHHREPLPGRPPHAAGKLASRDDELLSEECVLGEERGSSSEEVGHRTSEEADEVEHRRRTYFGGGRARSQTDAAKSWKAHARSLGYTDGRGHAQAHGVPAARRRAVAARRATTASSSPKTSCSPTRSTCQPSLPSARSRAASCRARASW
jgi:hypothetical protein